MTAPLSDDHVAHFYDDGASLSAGAASYLRVGLERGEGIVLISTAEHRDDIYGQLLAPRPDFSPDGRVVWLDARATLDELLPNGELDERRFQQVIAARIQHSIALAPARRVRAFGEMVGLLVAESRFDAAEALERLWNRLIETHPLSLFCAYPGSALADALPAFHALADLHTDLVPYAPSKSLASAADRRRAAELEQYARARDREAHARRGAARETAILKEASAVLASSLVSDTSPDRLAPTAVGAPIMIWASQPDKSCHYFNDGWLAFTGRRLDQEVGDGWAEGVHPDDRAACFDTYVQAFERRAAFRMEYRIRRFDGEYRRILDAGQPRFAPDGTFLGYIGGCIDVTEHRAAQQAQNDLRDRLQAAAHEWTRAFDSLSLGVFVIDEGGVVRRLNRTALDLAGAVQFDQVIGRAFRALGGNDEPWLIARDLLGRLAVGQPSSCSIRSHANAQQWEVAATPMITEDGATPWSIVTIRDTTAVANLQDALRRSESMAALGTLVSGVAHEVRNPLFGITATLQLFEGRLRDHPAFAECRGLLEANVQRLIELMQELLEYARPVEPAFADADLSGVVQQAVEACLHAARRRDVAIRSEIPSPLAPLRVDRRRLVQVFQNVISNAVTFSPSGTTVTVTARVVGTEVHCEIEDCGPGFTADEMPRVFEPFFTRRRDGTGLGLSIARRIVEAHAGTIAAANRPSASGGLIRITLPRSGAPPQVGP